MEQFRQDYLRQSVESLSRGKLISSFQILFPSEQVINLNNQLRQLFGSHLVQTGFLTLRSLVYQNSKIQCSQNDVAVVTKIDQILSNKNNQFWTSITDSSYQYIFQQRKDFFKSFIRGEFKFSNLHREAKLILKIYSDQRLTSHVPFIFKTHKVSDFASDQIKYSYVFSYDRGSKKLQQSQVYNLCRSSFLLVETYHPEDDDIDKKLVEMELALWKTEQFFLEHFKKSKRILNIILFINDSKAEKIWQIFQKIQSLDSKAELKRALVTKNLVFIVEKYRSLQKRLFDSISEKFQVQQEQDKEEYKKIQKQQVLDSISNSVKEVISFKYNSLNSLSPVRQSRKSPSIPKKIRNHQSNQNIKEKYKAEIESSNKNQQQKKKEKKQISPAFKFLQKQKKDSSSPTRNFLNSSIDSVGMLNASTSTASFTRKTQSAVKSILSPNRSKQTPKYNPNKVGSVDVTNYSPILSSIIKKKRESRSPSKN